MLDTLQWLQDQNVSEIIHNARKDIIAKLRKEYTGEAKAYLETMNDVGLPFLPFPNEPDPIIQIKNFINALYHAEDTFKDLEKALGQALEKEHVFTYLSLATNSPLVYKAYETISLFAQFGSHFFEVFKEELKSVVPFLTKLQSSIPDMDTMKYNSDSISNQAGLFLGHAINQMKPATGRIDYGLLTTFGATLPIYMGNISSLVEQYVSKVSKSTPEENKEKIAELGLMGEQLGRLIKNSAKGKIFFLANLLPLIRHIQSLLTQLTQAAGSLNDTIKDVIREQSAVLKFELIAGVFAFVDKLEIELMLKAGRLSIPLMVQMKPGYERLIQLEQLAVDFSTKGDSLVKLEDRRFIELRLAPTHQRLDGLTKSLFLVDEALMALRTCIYGLGFDEPPAPSLWSSVFGAASCSMTARQMAVLEKNYEALQCYLIELDHPVIKEINAALTSHPSNDKMRELFNTLRAVLDQIKTDRTFKIKLHKDIIQSVYHHANIVLFPYNNIQDIFNQLNKNRTVDYDSLSTDETWDRYLHHQHQYDGFVEARNVCQQALGAIQEDNYTILDKGIQFHPEYEYHVLDNNVIHQPDVLYLKLEDTELHYEVLEQKNACKIHLMSLDLAKITGHFDCYVWNVENHQLSYIDLNGKVQEKVILKNSIQFMDAINKKERHRLRRNAFRENLAKGVFFDDIILDSQTVHYMITSNGGHVPGIVHRGSMPLTLLSNTLTTFADPNECKPYQPRLVQELYNRGHIKSDCRSKWVQWYSALQPYLIRAFEQDLDIKAFDKQMVSVFTGNFFNSDVTLPDSDLVAGLQQRLLALSRYLSEQIENESLLKDTCLSYIKNGPSFVKKMGIIDSSHKKYVGEVAEYMHSDEPIRRHLHHASKRLLKLDLATQYLERMKPNQNLLNMQSSDGDYIYFQYLQDYVPKLEDYLRKDNKPYKVITPEQLGLFLSEMSQLERACIQNNELILDSVREKHELELYTGYSYIKRYDGSVKNMFIQLNRPEPCLLVDADVKIEEKKLYFYRDADSNQVQCKLYHYGQERTERLPSTIITPDELNQPALSTLSEEKLSTILAFIYDKRGTEIELDPSRIGPEEGLELYVWFKCQLKEIQRAEEDFSHWLDCVTQYNNTKDVQFKQKAARLYIYIQPYLISALENHEHWRMNHDTHPDVVFKHFLGQLNPQGNILVYLVNQFFSQEKKKIESKNRGFRRQFRRQPLQTPGLAKEPIQDRSDYLIKTTHSSKQLSEFKKTVLEYQTYLDASVLNSLKPCQSGVPFPNVKDPKQRLREPHQLLVIKKAINLFYYIEKVMGELESVQSNAWRIGAFDFLSKVAYVCHFVTAYVDSIKIPALIVDVLKDKHSNVILKEMVLQNRSVMKLIHELSQMYLTVDITETPALGIRKDSAILQWVTILKLLPDRLNTEASANFDTSSKALQLKRSAEKTAYNVEKILSDLNPVIKYFALGLDGFKVRSLINDTKTMFSSICLGINKKTTDDLREINTKFLSAFTVEADAIEYRFGLTPGLLSTTFSKIADEFYKGLISPLIDDENERLELSCRDFLTHMRLSAAQVRYQTAEKNRDRHSKSYKDLQSVSLSPNDQIKDGFQRSLPIIKNATNGVDLRLMSLIECLDSGYVDCFVWDESCLYYVDVEGTVNDETGGTLYLLNLPKAADVPDELRTKPVLIKQDERYYIHGNPTGREWTRTELDADIVSRAQLDFSPIHGDLTLKIIEVSEGNEERPDYSAGTNPTLVKYGNRYFIYGRKKLGQWDYTELDATVITSSILNFHDRKSINVNNHNSYRELYRHILFKKGHNQNVKRLIRYDSKLQSIYDEVADKTGHTFPIRLNSLTKIWTLIEKKKRESRSTHLYLTEQEIKTYITSNSRFILNKNTINFGEQLESVPVLSEGFCAKIMLLDSEFIESNDIIFIRKGNSIQIGYCMINGQYNQITVDNPKIISLLSTYPQSGIIKNMSHLSEIKSYVTLLEISSLMQRGHDLGENFNPTLKEIKLIREITKLCSDLFYGFYHTDKLNIEKSECQFAFINEVGAAESRKNIEERVNNKINALCADEPPFRLVNEEYFARLKEYLQGKCNVKLSDSEFNLGTLDVCLADEKLAFGQDNLTKYYRLDVLRCVLLDFNSYLTSSKHDKTVSAKQGIITHIHSIAIDNSKTVDKRIELIKDYLRDESHLPVLLTCPTYEPYSFSRLLQLIARLFEAVGLYTPTRIQCTDRLVDALWGEPRHNRPASCSRLGFFAPTQQSILTKWRDSVEPINTDSSREESQPTTYPPGGHA